MDNDEEDKENHEENDDAKDPDWKENITRRAHYYRKKKERSDTVTLNLNTDEWLDNVSLISNKTFSSNRKAVQIAAAAVSGAEGNASHLKISKSTLHRRRDTLRVSSDKIISTNFTKKTEGHLFLLHWDEKTLRHIRQVDGSNTYMAVVLTDLGKDRRGENINHY